MEDSVVFKAEKKIFRLVLNENAGINEILAETEKKLHKAKSFFKGETIVLGYTGKTLTGQDENDIKNLFENIANISVKEIKPYQMSELKQITPSYGLSVKSVENDSLPTEKIRKFTGSKIIKNDMTKFIKGTVRSGILIQYDGNVVILGDVNPGAEIKAKGNIIVMGTIKGLVHAGIDGDRNAYVISNNLKPTQLRIADLITRPPDSTDGFDSFTEPEVASIQENNIIIDPLSVFINKK